MLLIRTEAPPIADKVSGISRGYPQPYNVHVRKGDGANPIGKSPYFLSSFPIAEKGTRGSDGQFRWNGNAEIIRPSLANAQLVITARRRACVPMGLLNSTTVSLH